LRPLAEASLAAAERGSDLVSRLLSFARLQPLDPKPIDINELALNLNGMLRRTLGEQIELEIVRDEELWQAEADAPQLENAVLNLCLNARDAMPKGGRLTIETANVQLDKSYADQNVDVEPGPYVMIAVSDTGVGMSPEVLARAFDPFFTTKDVGKGTGLGLSMVFGFAKQSNGHVAIYSEEGHGTTVKLYLPRAEGDPSHTAKQPRVAAPPRGSESILLVEDNDLVRKHIAALLQSLGYNVIAAQNGIEAIDVLAGTTAIDLLFTDVVMPGPVNGRELANRAKQLRPELPVLFTSGYTENALMHHGRLDPGIQLLGKPFRIGDLAQKIREVLETD
jgi:CheY-like chemotaxis protein